MLSEVPLALIFCDSITRKGLICKKQFLQFVTIEFLCTFEFPPCHFSSCLKRECLPKGPEKKFIASCQFPKFTSSTRISSYQDAPRQTPRGAICNLSFPSAIGKNRHLYRMPLEFGVKGWGPHPYFLMDNRSLVPNRAESLEHIQCSLPTRANQLHRLLAR